MKANIKNAIYEILQNEADSMSNLTLVDNTRGMNGYPERMSWSIIGFMNKEELNKVAEELAEMLQETVNECTDEEEREELEQLDVCRQLLHKRDGWNLWEVEQDNYTEEQFDMSAIKSEEENQTIFKKGDYEEEEDFIIEQVSGILEGLTSFVDMKEILYKKCELWKAIHSLEDDKIVAMDVNDDTFEVIDKYEMSYSEDTHNYTIALSII